MIGETHISLRVLCFLCDLCANPVFLAEGATGAETAGGLC